MKQQDVLNSAFSMPLTSPLYPPTTFRFFDREFLIITYETDIEALRRVVPEPLEVTDPIVKYEFIRMPNSRGFGDYTESGQVIPVSLDGVKGGYVHSMYLDNEPATAAGREIWGFPKKYAHPFLGVENDTVLGRLKYNSVDVAVGTMGFKYDTVDTNALEKKLTEEANYLLKIIPHCSGKSLDVCQLVTYHLEDVNVKEAWSGPASLQLFEHALAPVAALPVKKVISGLHFKADLTLGMGSTSFDYLKQA